MQHAPSNRCRCSAGIGLVRSYRKEWLRRDLAAGLILTALLVPQGMAYAELAGLPPITGLYTSILCLVGYAVFGPSRVLVLGPDSSLGPMIAACVIPLVAANGDPGRAVAYASILALMVGAITALAGIFKLGFVADLLSKPTQIGYMNGLALTIVIGQLPKLFGFSVDADGLIAETIGLENSGAGWAWNPGIPPDTKEGSTAPATRISTSNARDFRVSGRCSGAVPMGRSAGPHAARPPASAAS